MPKARRLIFNQYLFYGNKIVNNADKTLKSILKGFLAEITNIIMMYLWLVVYWLQAKQNYTQVPQYNAGFAPRPIA